MLLEPTLSNLTSSCVNQLTNLWDVFILFLYESCVLNFWKLYFATLRNVSQDKGIEWLELVWQRLRQGAEGRPLWVGTWMMRRKQTPQLLGEEPSQQKEWTGRARVLLGLWRDPCDQGSRPGEWARLGQILRNPVACARPGLGWSSPTWNWCWRIGSILMTGTCPQATISLTLLLLPIPFSSVKPTDAGSSWLCTSNCSKPEANFFSIRPWPQPCLWDFGDGEGGPSTGLAAQEPNAGL